jgi:serine/threonine-protein kinase
MSTNSWDRIGSAFSRLVDLPSEERTKRLASLADTEPEIHGYVEALLAADEQADELLARYEKVASGAWEGLTAEPSPPATQPHAHATVTSVPREGRSKAWSLSGHQIPPELLDRAAGRLRMVAAVIAIALTVYIVISSSASLGFGLELGQTIPTRIVFVAMLLVSIGVYFLSRSRWLRPEHMLNVGLVYEVILAFGGAVAVQFFASELRLPIWGVSEVAVLILVFAALVPNKPGRVLFAALVAATMDPIGDLVYGLRGGVTLSLSEMVGAYYANYLAAGVALVTAHVITRLAKEVGEARELGSYRLVEPLGKGGMGEVWRAEHRMLARPAAIKLIRPDVLLDVGEDRETLLHRFEREAQTTAMLRSPHTIELYDFGVTPEGSFYYVMELLEGLNMQTLVERFGPLPPGRAVHLLRQVCDSLVEAHADGLVHRDVKPANVYVCRYGMEADFVKVLDFGLVGRRPGLLGDARLTMGRSPGGTPAFMAPEQILGDRPMDGRTDIYSVGCLAFWLLTGRCVFQGATSVDVLMKQASEEPEPPSASSNCALPSGLDELVLACLEKDPDLRPPSARALRSRVAGCGVEPWTTEDAERWWDLHQPRDRSKRDEALPPRTG